MKTVKAWWKDVPGYDGKYQASRAGEIRHVYDSGRTRTLTPYRKKSKVTRRRLFVHLTKDGKTKETAVSKIVAEAFIGMTPPGLVLYHINGDVTDNRVDNLGFISRSELGRMTGPKSNKRKAVFKVNSAGEEVDVYPSARAAAKDNHMSYQTVIDRCKGKTKNPFKWYDYTFRYEE